MSKTKDGVQPVQPRPKGKAKGAVEAGPARRSRRLFDLIPGWSVDDYALPHIGVWLVGVASLAPGRYLVDDVLARWLILVVVAVAFGGILPLVAWTYSTGARLTFQRAHAVISCVLVGVGSIGTMLIGLTAWWAVLFLGAGHTLALSWNIRRADVIKGEGKDGNGDGLGWDEALDLKGSKATIVEDTPSRRRVRVSGVNGTGVADIRSKLPRIVAAAGGLRGAGRVIDRPRENEADILIVKRDVLKRPPTDPPWTGQRRSFADGAELMLSQLDVPVKINLSGGKDFGPTNLQVMGMTRSGKSHFYRLFARDISRTFDAVLWTIDTIKGRQTLPPVLPAVDWFVETREEAAAMLNGIRHRVIPARAAYLGAIELDEWEPGCGLAALVVWIEEAAQLELGTLYTRIVETCLSVGIFLVNSMQRATHDNLPTSARANMAAGVCFAVQSKTDSGTVLPDDVNELCLADTWGTTKQGACYAVIPGNSPELRGLEARTWWVERADITTEIAANASGMCQLDEVTAEAMGKPYADRELRSTVIAGAVPVSPKIAARLGQLARTGAGQTSRPDAGATPDQSEDVPMDDDETPMVDETDPALATPPLPVAYQGAEQDMQDIDPRAPLSGLPAGTTDVVFVPPIAVGDRLEGQARHDAWEACVAQVAAEGAQETDGSIIVTTSDLLEVWLATPGVDARMRPWMHGRIASLIEAGLATREEPAPGVPGRGRYRLSAHHDWLHPSLPVVVDDEDDDDVSPGADAASPL